MIEEGLARETCPRVLMCLSLLSCLTLALTFSCCHPYEDSLLATFLSSSSSSSPLLSRRRRCTLNLLYTLTSGGLNQIVRRQRRRPYALVIQTLPPSAPGRGPHAALPRPDSARTAVQRDCALASASPLTASRCVETVAVVRTSTVLSQLVPVPPFPLVSKTFFTKPPASRPCQSHSIAGYTRSPFHDGSAAAHRFESASSVFAS